jgi:hypothetical protein
MEHVNNDMDDLFRKAGDLYPLKTSESDWDNVLGKLQDKNFGNQTGISGLPVRADRKKRRWLFLLLLIPVSLGGLFYFSASKKEQQSNSSSFTGKNNAIQETGETHLRLYYTPG